MVMIANGEQTLDLLARIGLLSDTLERVVRAKSRRFHADVPVILEMTGLLERAREPFSKDTALRILAVVEPILIDLDGFTEDGHPVPAVLVALDRKVKALRAMLD